MNNTEQRPNCGHTGCCETGPTRPEPTDLFDTWPERIQTAAQEESGTPHLCGNRWLETGQP